MPLQMRGPMQQQPIQYIQPPAPQMRQQSPLSGAAGQVATKVGGQMIDKGISALAPKVAGTALGSATGALGAAAPGVLGAVGSALPALGPAGMAAGALGKVFGLFNEGGAVPWWKAAMQRAWGSKRGKKGSIADQINWGGKNDGGMIHQMDGTSNPYGYNEGGMAGETPMKRVMDEQKLEQNAMAFELEQKRKQEAHDMAMRQKQAAFSEAQKMKKASATTSMKPAKPKGPLGK